jgi:hypothetical protein
MKRHWSPSSGMSQLKRDRHMKGNRRCHSSSAWLSCACVRSRSSLVARAQDWSPAPTCIMAGLDEGGRMGLIGMHTRWCGVVGMKVGVSRLQYLHCAIGQDCGVHARQSVWILHHTALYFRMSMLVSVGFSSGPDTRARDSTALKARQVIV